MPRLVGQKSHTGIYIVPLVASVLVAGGALQYLGVIDVPGIIQRARDRFDQNRLTDRVPDSFVIGVSGQERNDAKGQ
ncbi:hypothetical protein GS597_15835 [Synechococcales cyanobacterium C]|uniref:Uncharacterized protein n=1 Tax=Petrachloros mirabilis ULC683 TaxID=2781853 RepID=A0A8K1ZZ11_9CYAN|nr:hypothetical protein [Petrachloros mirabilis]NCJ07950.1 hypothetical protein [Petrachloros mirabilis ULC683]